MKRSKIKKEAVTIAGMLLLVCLGYKLFFNNAFTGYEAQGKHIWLSASTVKFVNNWLKEGPLKLRFIMYEHPDSIEFNSYAERDAYISYPPGALIAPYIQSKLSGKSEIQLRFIKHFLELKFLFDTILVSLIAYSLLRFTLCLERAGWAAFTSALLALSWMCFPVNLYYLRNVYFTDQSVISLVLLFILLEIYDNYFTTNPQRRFLKYAYIGVKFIVSLWGVLTDYYFLFVLFVSWLVKIIPLFRVKNAVKNVVSASWVYVLPVFMGVGLFIWQLTAVPNFKNLILRKANSRMFTDGGDYHGSNKIISVVNHFADAYPFGAILLLSLLLLCVYIFINKRIYEALIKKYNALFCIMLIVCIPPILQVLTFQQHSAVHGFSVLKFSLPVIFCALTLALLLLELKKVFNADIIFEMEKSGNSQKIKIPVFYSCVIAISLFSVFSMSTSYLEEHMGKPVSYEREYLIRDNYDFNDVYFSFTESIRITPPQHLAISKKLIYKIDDISEIAKKFPNLKPAARTLLIVKDGGKKSGQVMEKEQNAIQNAQPLFESEHYSVYAIER